MAYISHEIARAAACLLLCLLCPTRTIGAYVRSHPPPGRRTMRATTTTTSTSRSPSSSSSTTTFSSPERNGGGTTTTRRRRNDDDDGNDEYYDIDNANNKSSSSRTSFLSYPLTQVVSDVDDTLKSSGGLEIGGVSLGGIDVQYDRGEFYPGVFQFMWELSLHGVLLNEGHHHRQQHHRNIERERDRRRRRRGRGGGGTDIDRREEEEEEDGGGSGGGGGGDVEGISELGLSPPMVAVLTARAEELKGALEIKNGSKLALAFRNVGESSTIRPTVRWGIGPVLYGSVSEWIIQDRKGQRKFSNFEKLLEQDPTGGILQYVYVGDTGELDQEAGETMLREYPEVVRAVFLHVVVSDMPSTYPPGGVRVPSPKLICGRPLVFFRTYVGAAARAVQLGLMEPDALMRVVEEAERALTDRGVPMEDSKWVDLSWDIDEAYRTMGTMY
jgi:hypothetical protein